MLKETEQSKHNFDLDLSLKMDGQELELKNIPEEFQKEVRLENNIIQIVDSRIPSYSLSAKGRLVVNDAKGRSELFKDPISD